MRFTHLSDSGVQGGAKDEMDSWADLSSRVGQADHGWDPSFSKLSSFGEFSRTDTADVSVSTARPMHY